MGEVDHKLEGGLEDEASFRKSNEILHARDIDAYWLQRELNKFYNDAEEARSKAEETLQCLKEASDERDLENKLVLLLGHDKFAIIKVIRKHKKMVLYCTLLAMAQNKEERQVLEQEMLVDAELNEVLQQLNEEGKDAKKENVKKG